MTGLIGVAIGLTVGLLLVMVLNIMHDRDRRQRERVDTMLDMNIVPPYQCFWCRDEVVYESVFPSGRTGLTVCDLTDHGLGEPVPTRIIGVNLEV